MGLLDNIIAWASSQNKLQWLEHILFAYLAYCAAKRFSKMGLSSIISAVPGAQAAVDRTINAEVQKAMKTLFPKTDSAPPIYKLPSNGMDKQEILATMQQLQSADCNGHDGKAFAYIYDTNIDEHNDFIQKAFTMYMHENGLNPVAFPILRKFEVEVVQMTLNMLHADETTAVGTMTSGGTESILCAIKAYRDRGKKLLGITEPEMICPQTIHPAFEKAAHYFGVKVIHIPVDNTTFRVQWRKYEAAITNNTIVLIASAPQYPHGVVDPIEEIAALALRRKLPMHVDACIGGFILPFVEKLGYKIPLWDFRVKGVTSISADVHKYGYCPKGASVLAYSSEEYRKYQFFTYCEWPGGLFVSPSLLGSRPGGSIAAAWASLVSLGSAGFMEIAKKTMDTVEKIKAAVNASPDLCLLGKPDATIVSFTTIDPTLSILAIADVMEDKFGWKMERQQHPSSVHLTVMPPHTKVADEFLSQMEEAIAVVKATPELADKGTAAMYGLVAKIPENAIVDNFLTTFMGTVYKKQPQQQS